MEIIAIAALVIVFLLVLGVELTTILLGVVIILKGFSFLCLLFLGIAGIISLFGKSKKATFNRIEKTERLGAYAVYLVDGEECRCIFPTDFIAMKFYRENKTVTVRMIKFMDRKMVFDMVSILVIILGVMAFGAFAFF